MQPGQATMAAELWTVPGLGAIFCNLPCRPSQGHQNRLFAMSDLERPFGGGLTPIEAVIDLAKSDCPHEWSRYRELAQKLAQQSGQPGILPEDAARKRLAGEGTVVQHQLAGCDGWDSFISQLAGGPAKPRTEFQLMFAEAQCLERLFRNQLAAALQSGRYCLTAFDAHVNQINVSPILIKPEQFQFGSEEMLLGDGLKIFGVRVAPANPQPLSTRIDRSGRKPGQPSPKGRACKAVLSILNNDAQRPTPGRGRKAELARMVCTDLKADGQSYQENSVAKMIRETVSGWESQHPGK